MHQNKKIIITQMNDGICLLNLEDEKPYDIVYEATKVGVAHLGDIYIGKVQKIVPSLNAAFIEIGPGQLCYYSLNKQSNILYVRKSKSNLLQVGDEILVQISRESVKSKLPVVTTNLTLKSECLVLTSENKAKTISSKIKQEDSQRIKTLLEKYQHLDFGLIVRTNAAKITMNELEHEVDSLAREYQSLVGRAMTRPCFTCMKTILPFYLNYIQDMLKESLEEIVTDDLDIYHELEDYFEKFLPEMTKSLRLQKDVDFPLKKLYNISGIIDHATNQKVWMKSGAYLLIEPTETMTVIDVNSGKCVTKKKQDEQNHMINMEAAREIVRQIRLRNLSGIIIIDFINLSSHEKRNQLISSLKKDLSKDKVKTEVVDIGKLQLVGITRQKIRKSLLESLKNI